MISSQRITSDEKFLIRPLKFLAVTFVVSFVVVVFFRPLNDFLLFKMGHKDHYYCKQNADLLTRRNNFVVAVVPLKTNSLIYSVE